MMILPDHLHCLWTLRPGDADFSTRWRLIKSSFARAIAPEERLFDYIHYSPVKHGWVKRVNDWPHSSFHGFVKLGVYPMEWAAPVDIRELDLE